MSGNLNVEIRKKSLAQKYFLWLQSCEIWCLLRKKTRFNSSIYDCLQAALENPDTTCGLYATDGDCYELFRCLFWPVIMDCHRIDLRNLVFEHDFGHLDHLEDLPSEVNEQILSIRLRLNRSIQNYPMIPKLTVEQLVEIEERFKDAFKHFDEDLRGKYCSLKDISDTEQIKLREKGILFQEPIDRYLESAGAYNHWPNGRGFYVNERENFIVWVNEEDHLSFISQSDNSKLSETYERLTRATDQINQLCEFQQHQRLGYLNLSPLNIGTALEITVRVRLTHPERFDQLIELSKRLDISSKLTHDRCVISFSNLIRLGRTEFHIIRSIWNGIEQVIKEDMRE
ncbi:unnamed protein product [Adineta ricciae]|uniref:Arginine kinase n=1 Tax=Adineta ricciae TaxID=249248 RepID=A0A813SPX0_ADIRI|nr:unnamed protein product [Adineta ricciae]